MVYYYDILINPPKEVDLTVEQFNNLSWYGISALFCNYKVIFHYDDCGDLKMYFHRDEILERCKSNHRFKDILWHEDRSAEVYSCTIPKDFHVVKTIEKYFSHLIMKTN